MSGLQRVQQSTFEDSEVIQALFGQHLKTNEVAAPRTRKGCPYEGPCTILSHMPQSWQVLFTKLAGAVKDAAEDE